MRQSDNCFIAVTRLESEQLYMYHHACIPYQFTMIVPLLLRAGKVSRGKSSILILTFDAILWVFANRLDQSLSCTASSIGQTHR